MAIHFQVKWTFPHEPSNDTFISTTAMRCHSLGLVMNNSISYKGSKSFIQGRIIFNVFTLLRCYNCSTTLQNIFQYHYVIWRGYLFCNIYRWWPQFHLKSWKQKINIRNAVKKSIIVYIMWNYRYHKNRKKKGWLLPINSKKRFPKRLKTHL